METFREKKTNFRKMFQSIERANNKIWGARITRVKQMIFSGGYFTLIVKFARLSTLENRVTYIVATAEWPQKVSYRDGNRASLKNTESMGKNI